jgi:hypothetical protein
VADKVAPSGRLLRSRRARPRAAALPSSVMNARRFLSNMGFLTVRQAGPMTVIASDGSLVGLPRRRQHVRMRRETAAVRDFGPFFVSSRSCMDGARGGSEKNLTFSRNDTGAVRRAGSI